MNTIDAANGAVEQWRKDDGADGSRYIFSFSSALRDAEVEGDAESVRAMTELEPPLTGLPLFEAAVAGLSERHCRSVGLPIPRWTQRAARFIQPAALGPWDHDASHDVHPVLRKHGVLVDEADLDTRLEALKRRGGALRQ